MATALKTAKSKKPAKVRAKTGPKPGTEYRWHVYGQLFPGTVWAAKAKHVRFVHEDAARAFYSVCARFMKWRVSRLSTLNLYSVSLVDYLCHACGKALVTHPACAGHTNQVVEMKIKEGTGQ